MRSSSRWAPLALLLLTLACLFVRLGAPPLLDVDEGAFSEATREMVVSGDFGRTTLNGEPRYDKPILVYWLQAASVEMLGPTNTAFRLPSALCAAVWAWSVIAFVRRRLGVRTGWLAGAVTLTSLGVLVIGRAATADALLNALICLTMTDLWRYFESQLESDTHDSAERRSGRAALWRAFVWTGLGLLAKGPVAVLIPAAVGLLYCVSTASWRPLTGALAFWPGWLLMLAIAAPWYVYAVLTQGQAFIDGFFLKHNLHRFTGPLEGHRGGLFYYLVMGPVMWLPWSSALPAVMQRAPLSWRQPLGRFLWLWLGFVIVFFTLSGTKLPHYVLYGSTPMFMLIAEAVSLEQRRGFLHATGPAPDSSASTDSAAAPWGSRWSWLLPLALLALAGGLPQIVQHFAARSPEPLYDALLGHAAETAPGWFKALPWIALCAAVAGRLAVRARDLRFALGSALWALTLVVGIAPWLANLLQGPVVHAAQIAKARPETAVQWNLHFPSFAVYRQREAERRAPRPGELALVRSDHLRARPCADCTVLFAERGLALVLRAPTPGASAPATAGTPAHEAHDVLGDHGARKPGEGRP